MAHLADRTWPEVGTGMTLLIPLGSTEQHGPHLPLDTDTRIAQAIAEAAAEPAPKCAVAPALPYGASWEHAGFAGLMGVSASALTTFLIEIGRSLGPEVERVVYVNGHGGNAEAVAAAVKCLNGEKRSTSAWWPRIPGGDAHAGRTETSLMLHIDPGAVRVDRTESGNTEPLSDLALRLQSDGLRAVTRNGVLGDPTTASAEEGERIFVALVTQLDEELRSWIDQ